MNLIQYLRKWNLGSLSINAGFFDIELNFKDADRDAAWEMYVELLTRVSTQHLLPEHGDEKATLSSLHQLFEITRTIIRKNGPECIVFAKIAIIILNQLIRPFTSKWHKCSLEGGLNDEANREQFRTELAALQVNLRHYTQLLSSICEVEDLTLLTDPTQ